MNKKILLIVIVASIGIYIYLKEKNKVPSTPLAIVPPDNNAIYHVNTTANTINQQTNQALAQGYTGTIDSSQAAYAAAYSRWIKSPDGTSITDPSSSKVYKIV